MEQSSAGNNKYALEDIEKGLRVEAFMIEELNKRGLEVIPIETVVHLIWAAEDSGQPHASERTRGLKESITERLGRWPEDSEELKEVLREYLP